MSNVLPEDSKSFIETQTCFTNFIRNPQQHPMPEDIKPERILMYRELLFNNVNSFLVSNFPVLHEILDANRWFEIAQEFFSRHHCDTPYFSEIPEEFINYLQDEKPVNENDPPFMLELAHYEWVEMALSISKEELIASSQAFLDSPCDFPLYLSALAWPLMYQYPVHRVSPEFMPNEAPESYTYLVVYRDLDDEVRFSEVTAVTLRLLEILQQQPGITTQACLKQLIEECQAPDQKAFFQHGYAFISAMVKKNIICDQSPSIQSL